MCTAPPASSAPAEHHRRRRAVARDVVLRCRRPGDEHGWGDGGGRGRGGRREKEKGQNSCSGGERKEKRRTPPHPSGAESASVQQDPTSLIPIWPAPPTSIFRCRGAGFDRASAGRRRRALEAKARARATTSASGFTSVRWWQGVSQSPVSQSNERGDGGSRARSRTTRRRRGRQAGRCAGRETARQERSHFALTIRRPSTSAEGFGQAGAAQQGVPLPRERA